jgi:hypothetical protein
MPLEGARRMQRALGLVVVSGAGIRSPGLALRSAKTSGRELHPYRGGGGTSAAHDTPPTPRLSYAWPGDAARPGWSRPRQFLPRRPAFPALLSTYRSMPHLPRCTPAVRRWIACASYPTKGLRTSRGGAIFSRRDANALTLEVMGGAHRLRWTWCVV